MPKLLIIAILATWCHCSIAHHDPQCNPENTKVCVDSEIEGGKRSLRCVESRQERTLPNPVTWLKNNEVIQIDDRVHTEDHPHHRLVFEEVLVSDEGNWTCSNGTQSPEFKFYAGKVNVAQSITSLNHSIGDNFLIPCNIELGVNTAQTNFNVLLSRRVFLNDGSNTYEFLWSYQHNTQPDVVSWNTNPTSYRFDVRNLTLYVENFSVPNPELVHSVRYDCEFNVIVQGMTIREKTTTAVIPGFHPPEIIKSLGEVTIIPRGSNHTFTVEVESHPPIISQRKFSWFLGDKEISVENASFIVDSPLTFGDISTFNLTILNASEQHYGILRFEVRLANSVNSTESLLIVPPEVQGVMIGNGCGDVTYGEGPLNFNLTLSSNFPALSQYQLSDLLQVHLQLNWSLIPDLENERANFNITTVDISDTLPDQWSGGSSVQLAVDRVFAVPSHVMDGIMGGDKRFRVQAKLIFNETAAAEWSPVCNSHIFQPCVEESVAEIKLTLIFSEEDQCSRYALQLLIRHFSQRKEMVEGFKQVQLLVSAKDIENHNKIRKNLDKLKFLVEESELWIQKLPREEKVEEPGKRKLSRKMSIAGPMDEEIAAVAATTDYISKDRAKGKGRRGRTPTRSSRLLSDPGLEEPNIKETLQKYEKVREILVELTDLCKAQECAHEQRLLRNMNAHEVVLELLQVPYNHKDDYRMREIMHIAHEFLQNFCRNNVTNQSLLHRHIQLFLQSGDSLVEADTLTEIFRDNAHLCSKVTESEIQHFIHCIEKNRNVKYLKFLQTIVHGGKGSRRAQEMVMNENHKESRKKAPI